MENTSLATINQYTDGGFTPEKIALIKRTIANGATDDELALFINHCQRTGLDPFAKQIFSIPRFEWDPIARTTVKKMDTQVSIDGLRLIAERSGAYGGQVGPFFCGPDGEWTEVWTSKDYPFASRVGVVRSDFKEPLFAVALWSEYCPMYDGKPGAMWAKYPTVMLAKSAEALALRRAFPHELSGISTSVDRSDALGPEEQTSLNMISVPTWVKEEFNPDPSLPKTIIDIPSVPESVSENPPSGDVVSERPYSPLYLKNLISDVASKSPPATERVTVLVDNLFLKHIPDPLERSNVVYFLMGVRDPLRASPRAVQSVFRWLKPDSAGTPSAIALEELTAVRLHLAQEN